ncbi:MAG TPA: hypothetical protein VL574_12860 [Stellaceae bacterium]|nr:hypothetical protein [Stellaceae bacterium]
MRTQRYRVILFEPGTGKVIGEQRVLARSDQDAAECLCGVHLGKAGGMQQLAAQVAPVDSPAQRQLFYVSPSWEATASQPQLALVHAYVTHDPLNRLAMPYRLKATMAAIEALGGEPIEGSAEVVSTGNLNVAGEYIPGDDMAAAEMIAYHEMPASPGPAIHA